MKFVKFWLPTVIWMAIIFALSSRPRVQVSEDINIQFLIFKTGHIIEYAFLYLLMYRSLKNTSKDSVSQNRTNAFLLTFFYAVSDEIHQRFVPTRTGKVRDVVIDTIGISLISFYIWKYLPTAPKPLKNWAKKLQLI